MFNNAVADIKYPMAADRLPRAKPTRPRGWLWFWNVIGAIDMPNAPRVWGFNPAVITLVSMLVLTIGGGGYYLGRQSEQINNIQKQADDAKRDAKNAKDIALSAGTEPTATFTPTPGRR